MLLKTVCHRTHACPCHEQAGANDQGHPVQAMFVGHKLHQAHLDESSKTSKGLSIVRWGRRGSVVIGGKGEPCLELISWQRECCLAVRLEELRERLGLLTEARWQCASLMLQSLVPSSVCDDGQPRVYMSVCSRHDSARGTGLVCIR